MNRKFNELSATEQKDLLVRLAIFSISYERLEVIFNEINPVLQENNTFDQATSTKLIDQISKYL